MKYNRSDSLVAPPEKSSSMWFFSAATCKTSIIIGKYQTRQTAHSELEQMAVDYSNRLGLDRSKDICGKECRVACLITLPRQFR